MKNFIILLCIFFILLGVFFLYMEKETHDFINKLPKMPRSLEQVESKDTLSDLSEPSSDLSTTSESESVVSTMSGSDETRVTKFVDIDPEDPLVDFDWRDDEYVYDPEQDDPLGDYLKEAEARARGTWIGDPERMDRNELRNAEYNQLLERFGDIPEVHTYMEYSRKWDNNIPLTLDEEIEELEALNYLFPSGTNKRTLDYYNWLRVRAGPSGNLQHITRDDIVELRSMGIRVDMNRKKDGGMEVTISTK